jgi:hypothetical protein
MEKKSESNPLAPVLCEECMVSAVLMALGQCDECGGVTTSCSYKFCGSCATKKGVCSLCGEPLDRKAD